MDNLLSSVLRSRYWVDICCNFLLERSRAKDEDLRRIFAEYYLEAVVIEESAKVTFARLVNKIQETTGMQKDRIVYILEQESLSALGKLLFNGDVEIENERYALVAERDVFYRLNENASNEDVFRENLMKKAWDISWSICPGYPVFCPKSDIVQGHSFFDPLVISGQKLISTIVPTSDVVRDYILNELRRVTKSKPKLKVMLFTQPLLGDEDSDSLTYKGYDLCERLPFIRTKNMAEKEVVGLFRGNLPGIPLRRMKFEEMFKELQKELPLGTNAYYRSFNHTRENGIRIAIELELGLVIRSYPEQYVGSTLSLIVLVMNSEWSAKRRNGQRKEGNSSHRQLISGKVF